MGQLHCQVPDLKRSRYYAALTQRELAELAGLSHTTVWSAEQGNAVRPLTAHKLTQAIEQYWSTLKANWHSSTTGRCSTDGKPCQ